MTGVELRGRSPSGKGDMRAVDIKLGNNKTENQKSIKEDISNRVKINL